MNNTKLKVNLAIQQGAKQPISIRGDIEISPGDRLSKLFEDPEGIANFVKKILLGGDEDGEEGNQEFDSDSLD